MSFIFRGVADKFVGIPHPHYITSFQPTNIPPGLKGKMLKQGHVAKSMKERFFKLKRGVLYYFCPRLPFYSPTEENTKLKGYIELWNYVLVTDDETLDALQILLRSRDGNKEYFFECSSEVETNMWRMGLAAHIRFSQPPELMDGVLKKEGHFVKNMKDRFFVLEYGVLSYYAGTRYCTHSLRQHFQRSINISLI